MYRKLLAALTRSGTQKSFLRDDNFADWGAILQSDAKLWKASLKAAEKGPPVLVATNVGGHGPASVVESMLAAALTLRGAKVHTLLCDGVLPGCLHAQIDLSARPQTLIDYELGKSLCPVCLRRGSTAFKSMGLSHHGISELLTDAERRLAREISREVDIPGMKSFAYEGLAVGEHGLSGALRYFARGTLDQESPEATAIAQRYLEAATLTVFAVRRLVKSAGIKHAVFHHGIYVPQGIVGEVCRAEGVHVSNWVVAYRKNTLIFSHDNTYHRTLMEEPTDQWKSMQWSKAREDEIVDYLGSRWYGTRDWIYFHEKPNEDLGLLKGLDFQKPTIGLLTNVFWDAQLHYRQSIFENMLIWLAKTIEYFRKRQDLQLIVRIHPAEIRGAIRSRQLMMDEIRAAVPELPPNVLIVPPDSNLSTYAAMQACDSVIIYGTKTGVELTSFGIPVIVAGEAWIRNKGLTVDPSSEEEYYCVLDSLPFGKRLDAAVVREARKYAYHFFFRRMIPLPFVQPTDKWPNFHLKLNSLSDLAAGQSAGLDLICEGVMDRSIPFVYRAEVHGVHDRASEAAAADSVRASGRGTA